MVETYESKEWIYHIKGSRLKISFIAREEKTVSEMVRLVSAIMKKNPPSLLLKVRKVYIKQPPYEQEQEMLNWYRQKCKEKGVDPDAK